MIFDRLACLACGCRPASRPVYICLTAACARRYMRVYNATIKDRAFTYAIFFLFFSVHIIFCVWSAISPPLPFSNDWSHTGFICGIKAFGSNTFTGIVYVVGGSLWTLESLWSLWCLKGVRSFAFLYPYCNE